MKINFFLFSLLCLLVTSCKKNASFIEGKYDATYNGICDVSLHIYEYEKGQYAWIMHERLNGNNFLAGKVTFSFENGDTIAVFSKDVVIGNDYQKFEGLYDSLKINYTEIENIGILKFIHSDYVFFKKLNSQDEEIEKKIKDSMKKRFSKEIKN